MEFCLSLFSDELHEELLDSGKENVFNALNCFWLLQPHRVFAQNIGTILGSPGNTTGSAYAITSREREFSLSPPITFASQLYNIRNSSKSLTGADNSRADLTFKSGSWIGLGVGLVRFAIGINRED